jgi:type II secretory pathway pseudopilin PulG
MDAGIIGLIVAAVSAIASFAVGRWLAGKRREKKARQARAAEEATQSRQVRRAREREQNRGGGRP